MDPKDKFTAYSWHSGGGSPLYRLASNGFIDNETHRHELVEEVGLCIMQNDYYAHEDAEKGRPFRNERSQLLSLLSWVKTAKVKTP